MENREVLEGKKILIVDDEPDILETLEELLDMCLLVDSAKDYETAAGYLNHKTYDAVILDIMGVRGYDLLQIATEKGYPALMLTAHALSPDNLVKSVKGGAYAYVPKDKITDITTYLTEVIIAAGGGKKKPAEQWFFRLKPYYTEKFGIDWVENYKKDLSEAGLDEAAATDESAKTS